MPFFCLTCLDKPDSLDLRMETRAAHLAYLGGYMDAVRAAGPILDEAGEMSGSLFILEMADVGAARAFNAGDPYTRAGLFQRVEVHPFRLVLGQVGSHG